MTATATMPPTADHPPEPGRPTVTGPARRLPDRRKGMHWSLMAPVTVCGLVLAAWLAFMAFRHSGYSRSDVDQAGAKGHAEGLAEGARKAGGGDGRPVYYDYTKRLFHYPLSLMAMQAIGPESGTDPRLNMVRTAIVADEALTVLGRGVPRCSLHIAVTVGADGITVPHVVAPDEPGNHVPLLDCTGVEAKAPKGGGGS